jgi:LPXTG-motif cell wall-anchored protein
MKPQTNVIRKSRGTLVALSGMTLALGLAAVPTQADEWNKRTVLTISQPMQVKDTYLEPGQYVFKLLDSQSDRHIVQIYNGDQTHLITTILAIPDYRVKVTGKSSFRMWETPAGYVTALRSWYYPGDNFGQEFPYPKSLKQIAFNQTAQVTTAPAPVAEAAPAEPAPAPQPQAFAPEPPSQQAPVEIAQNTPPPAPAPEPAVQTPEPAPSQPTVLPKTASSYPLVGLMGLLLLALGGFLRYAQSA